MNQKDLFSSGLSKKEKKNQKIKEKKDNFTQQMAKIKEQP
jgi:hypothetical protein